MIVVERELRMSLNTTYVILSEESDMNEKYDPIWEEAESL